MEKIKIVDNFLDSNELKILNNIIETKSWGYGHRSIKKENNYKIDSIIDNIFFSTETNDFFFEKYILEKINLIFSKKFKINRNYMHIQTIALDGSYHIDDENQNTYSFCIYINTNPENDIENIGGDLFIKIPNNKNIIGIEPKNNRGILFPSYYYHKGDAFNRSAINEYRLCITWKLE